MKQLQTVVLIFLIATTASAQKQTYRVFSYTQKIINAACGTAELIKDADENYTPEEVATYKTNYGKILKTKYNSKNRYNRPEIVMVSSKEVAILYEYKINPVGWKCTYSKYGVVIARNWAAAEKQFEDSKNRYKEYECKEIKRWAKGT